MGIRLDGWKEIASHLDKSVKTAQRWERSYGLPVHRVTDDGNPGGATVFAFVEEVDEWLASRDGRGTRAPTSLPAPRRWRAVAGWSVVFSLLLLTVLSLAYAIVHDDNPARVERVDETRLAAYDADGHELWSKRFDTSFVGHLDQGGAAWELVDLNRDGTKEVVFARVTERPMPGPDDGLFCYDRRGDARWRYSPGRRIRLDGFTYASEFMIRTMKLGDRGDQRPFIVVTAVHRPYSPTQVTVLDEAGRTLTEYWNMGYVLDVLVDDFDGDAVDEILLGGINDALDRPFVALIEHDIGAAVGPGLSDYPAHLRSGRETAYLIFPHTAVSEALGKGSWVRDLRPYEDGFIADIRFDDDLGPKERVYLFDQRMNVIRLDFPRGFVPLHHSLLQEGRISVGLDEEHARLLNVERIVPAADPE